MSHTTKISGRFAVSTRIFRSSFGNLLMTIRVMNPQGFSTPFTSNRGKYTNKSFAQSMAVTLVLHESALIAFAGGGDISDSDDGRIVKSGYNGHTTVRVTAADNTTMIFGRTKAQYICAVMAQIGEFSQLEALPAKEDSIAHETIASTYYSDKKEQFLLKLSYINNGWHNSLSLDVCQVQDILVNLKHVQAFVDAWVAKDNNHGIPAEFIARTHEGYPYLKLERIRFGFVKALIILAHADLLKKFERKVMKGVQETKNVAKRVAKLETGTWMHVGYDSEVLAFPMLAPEMLDKEGNPTRVIEDDDDLESGDTHQELNTIDTEPTVMEPLVADDITEPKFLNCDALMIENPENVVEIMPSLVEIDLISEANAV